MVGNSSLCHVFARFSELGIREGEEYPVIPPATAPDCFAAPDGTITLPQHMFLLVW